MSYLSFYINRLIFHCVSFIKYILSKKNSFNYFDIPSNDFLNFQLDAHMSGFYYISVHF